MTLSKAKQKQARRQRLVREYQKGFREGQLELLKRLGPLVDSKACSKCGATKPAADFHRSQATKDGLTYNCKGCSRGKAAAESG